MRATIAVLSVLGFGICVLLVFCSAAVKTSEARDSQHADDLAAVRDVSKRIIAADNSGDIAAVSELYDDDAIWLPPTGPVVEGKAAILTRYKKSFDYLKLAYSEESVETQVSGDWAFQRGFVRGIATPKDGAPAKATFDKYIMILHCGKDRRWRIARLMWSPASAN